MTAFPGSNVEEIEDVGEEDDDDDDDDAAGKAMAAPGTRGSAAPSKCGSVGQASHECVKCGQVLLPSAKFCTECGTQTGGAAAAAPAVIVSVAEVESIAEAKEEKPKEEAAPKKQQRVAPEDVVDIVSKVRGQ